VRVSVAIEIKSTKWFNVCLLPQEIVAYLWDVDGGMDIGFAAEYNRAE